MNTKKRYVIFISKQKISLNEVILAKEPKLGKTAELAWDLSSMERVFQEIKEITEDDKIRILLSEDLSYVLDIEVPKDKRSNKGFITEKMAERVPENISGLIWDYKEIDVKKEKVILRVFAPVSSFFSKLMEVLEKLKIDVEVVEAESLAVERHDNPVIGLAIKEDVKEKDGKVLNLKPMRHIELEEEPPGGDRVYKKRLIFILLAIILLLSVVVIGFFLWRNKGNSTNNEIPAAPVETPAESVEENSSNEEEVKDEDKSEEVVEETREEYKKLHVLLLNGSGVSGRASEFADFFKNLGYINLSTGNAESYDYTGIIIRAKKIHEDKLPLIIDDLESGNYSAETASDEYVEETSEYDVVVTIGV